MIGKAWSIQEISLLRDLVSQRLSYVDIAKRLGRSVRSVRLKALSLGIRRIPYKRWTEEEVQLLKELLKTKSLSELSRIFGRSKGAVASKVYTLELATEHYNDLRNTVSIKNNHPEWFKGYLAGLVDGEGTIGIEKASRNDRKNPHFKPIVKISNTCKEALDYIIEQVGGFKFAIKSGRMSKNSKKAVYDIVLVRHKDVEAFLEMILPYLLIKRRQAELVIQFCKSRLSKPNHAPYSDEEIAIIEEVKKINGRAYPYSFLQETMEVV
jgi:DNA-binding CsgD family transcriptional regulator